MTKFLIAILLLIFCFPSFGQHFDLIKLALEDSSNFNLTKALDNQKPQHIFLLEETDVWNPTRFKIENVDLSSETQIQSFKTDEHHPYNWSYLFKDSVLNQLISEKEKDLLFKKAVTTKSKRLTLKGSNFSLIRSYKKAGIGYFFSISEPLYTEDQEFAFIDFNIFYKEPKDMKIRDCSFGTTCLVYKRTNTGWQKLKEKNHLNL
jgi:hypothetical protein